MSDGSLSTAPPSVRARLAPGDVITSPLLDLRLVGHLCLRLVFPTHRATGRLLPAPRLGDVAGLYGDVTGVRGLAVRVVVGVVEVVLLDGRVEAEHDAEQQHQQLEHHGRHEQVAQVEQVAEEVFGDALAAARPERRARAVGQQVRPPGCTAAAVGRGRPAGSGTSWPPGRRAPRSRGASGRRSSRPAAGSSRAGTGAGAGRAAGRRPAAPGAPGTPPTTGPAPSTSAPPTRSGGRC